MLSLRILTAIAGGPAVLAAAWYGGLPLALLVLALSLVGSDEAVRLVGVRGPRASRPLVLGGAVTCTLLACARDPWGWAMFPAACAIACLGSAVASGGRRGVPEAMASLFCAVYGAYLPGHVLLVRALQRGDRLLLLVVAVTWATDTAAYFGGVTFGRHSMCPALSPKKTWEGAVSGAVAAVAVASALGEWAGFGPVIGAAVGAVGTVAAQVGDLAESAMKRWAGVKDSGTMIPGHGGVLDRFDSLFFAAPVMFWVFRMVGR